MSKLKQLTMAIAVMALPFVFALPAAAADCTISNTGPGSNNTCQSTTDYSCKVDNNNNVTVTNQNGQTVGTGTANTSGNTTGGGSTSGTAANSNGTTFSFQVTNEGCAVTAVKQPEAPAPSGGGAGAAKGKATAPTSLPSASGDTTSLVVASVLATSLAFVTALSAYTTAQSRL